MTAPIRFCTEHALAAGEPLAGTGTHQARNVLIRWPKGKWRHSLRIADGMGGALEAAVARVVAAGCRVNLIDRKDGGGGPNVFVMPDAQGFDVTHADLPAFLDAVPTGDLARFSPRPVAAPLVLCCTHGVHDRCCAKWGFAAYKALAAEAKRRGGFDVWECTHLGGCRLSGGALVLPAMHKYGRLAPADAAPLLAAEAKGRPYLPRYRGAAHLPPREQVAEVAAREALTGASCAAAITPVDEDRYDVTLGKSTVRVACYPETLRAYGACEDLLAAKPLEPKTVWRGEVLSITPKKEPTP